MKYVLVNLFNTRNLKRIACDIIANNESRQFENVCAEYKMKQQSRIDSRRAKVSILTTETDIHFNQRKSICTICWKIKKKLKRVCDKLTMSSYVHWINAKKSHMNLNAMLQNVCILSHIVLLTLSEKYRIVSTKTKRHNSINHTK